MASGDTSVTVDRSALHNPVTLVARRLPVSSASRQLRRLPGPVAQAVRLTVCAAP